MDKNDFDKECLRVIQFYGKEKYERVHFEELWRRNAMWQAW